MPTDAAPAPLVPRSLERAAAWSWRLLVLAAAAAGVFWLLGLLWVVVVALVVTVLLTRGLMPLASWLRVKGWRPGLAAGAALVGFLVALAGVVALIAAAVAGQAGDLGPTVSEGIDSFERWLIEDSPFDLDRADIESLRQQAGDALGQSLQGSGGAVVSGAMVAVELLAGLFLGLILTFFALKDGTRFVRWVRSKLPFPQRDRATRMGTRAWSTLGGYLRGAAILGLVEGIVIGVTMFLVGGELAVPVAVVTFMAAFVPFVGAIVAGVLAVLVALATVGTTGAIVVAVVAVVVQQIDNEALAPVVYGRALQLHPVVILVAVAVGGGLFGIAGSLLAVPVTAVAINTIDEARRDEREVASTAPSPAVE